MQAYSQGFARVYNQRWSGFARQVAPLILDYYTATPAGKEKRAVLDLCCGTGQLAVHLLENGFWVTGIDLSEPMLHHARENARPYIETDQARFIQADVSSFTLEERFGLVVSTFDALNHLEGEAALKSCFECVRAVCEGVFIFDLNTRTGLKRWNSINVEEGDDAVIINRGIYDGQGDKAWVRITGFVRAPDGRYERFEETAFNSVFDMEQVKTLLQETGWGRVHAARVQDLGTPLDDPESEGRVFFVAFPS
jgi:SAM-dependent methyltransferase